MPTALLVSPHPDDEVLGAGAAALALKGRGWRIVNLVCSLGRPYDHERRRLELTEAAMILGIETRIMEPPLAIGADDDHEAAAKMAHEALEHSLLDLDPAIVVAPSVHDGHHAHELVARATRDTIAAETETMRRVWWWRLWGQGGPPTLLVDCAASMPKLRRALRAHAGELDRNRFLDLLEADATADAVRGSEQVLGFGTHALGTTRARVYCETVHDRHGWRFGRPRVLGDGVFAEPTIADATPWLTAPSPSGWRRGDYR